MDRTDKQMTFLGDLLPLKLLITIIQNILEFCFLEDLLRARTELN